MLETVNEDMTCCVAELFWRVGDFEADLESYDRLRDDCQGYFRGMSQLAYEVNQDVVCVNKYNAQARDGHES